MHHKNGSFPLELTGPYLIYFQKLFLSAVNSVECVLYSGCLCNSYLFDRALRIALDLEDKYKNRKWQDLIWVRKKEIWNLTFLNL